MSKLEKQTKPVKRQFHDKKNQLTNQSNTEGIIDFEILPKFTENYVIVKNILNKLDWKDVETCKMVNKLWRDVALTLSIKANESTDFTLLWKKNNFALFESKYLRNVPPMLLLIFCSKFNERIKCRQFPGGACDPPCQEFHLVLDILESKYSHPKFCLEVVTTSYLIYNPLPTSPTFPQATKTVTGSRIKYIGMTLPQIPNVMFHSLGCKVLRGGADESFLKWLHNILEIRIVKGVIFLMNDSYNFLEETIEAIENHIQAAQPDYPIAMAGCLVKGVIMDFLDEFLPLECRMVKVLLFAVDREKILETNFDIHTLNIPKTSMEEDCIRNIIKKFESQIPKHKYSAAIRFSCIGRRFRHQIESECYRQSFPNTPVIGCFGHGELIWEHPNTLVFPPCKKQRHAVLSYSTIFMHLSWGPKVE